MLSENQSELTFTETLLEERDTLFQECSRLKSQLQDYADVEALKSSYEETIQKKDIKIAALERQIQQLLRQVWGKSSERFIKEDPRQRKLDFEGLDTLPEEEALAAKQAQEEIVEYKKRTLPAKAKQKPVRKPLPEHLERREEHIYPSDIDINSGRWRELPPEITEVIEHEPARCYVRRIVRHVYALVDKNEETTTPIVTAPMPALPIAKSYAGASMLAELMVGKYIFHLPFYRQIQMFKQYDVTLSSSTLNDWFKETADLLRPLYYRLREEVMTCDYLQVDETTIPVVHEEKHKTVKGYMWMVRSVMNNLSFFHYDQGSRAQKVAIGLLKDFQGALQTDGYEVYAIYENKKGVLPLGCWAHARRKYTEALKEDNARAEYALTQIGMLYDVERQADQESLSYDERAELRSRLSYPIMRAFEKWIVQEIPKSFPGGVSEKR